MNFLSTSTDTPPRVKKYCFIYTTDSNAQPMPKRCMAIADFLRKHGVDTLLYYWPKFSYLRAEENNSCFMCDHMILIWKKGNEVSSFNYFRCEYLNYEKSAVVSQFLAKQDSLQIINYLKANFRAIINDKLLPGLLKRGKYGKEETRDLSCESYDYYTVIRIIIGKKSYENRYLGNGIFDGSIRNADGTLVEKWQNLNYEKNITKPVYQLATKIDQLLANSSLK